MTHSSERVIAITFFLAVTAQARDETRPPVGQMTNDGSTEAPAGKPQLSNLLAGYPTRPPWMVAGVDYAVGVPAGTTLKDPATIVVTGIAVDAASRTVRVTGSNVSLDGYDFGLGGGWGIYIPSGTTNTTVKNSHFLVGANNLVPINSGVGSGTLTLRYNTFDGGGRQNGDVWSLVNYNGSGTFTAQHNSFFDAPSDAIDFNSGKMTTIVEYNVFKNLGTSPGAHPDSVQYVGVNLNTSLIAFNTIYQPNPSGMQGIQLAAQNGSSLTDTSINHNVIIAKAGSQFEMSYGIAIQQSPGNMIHGVVIENNYIDSSGSWGPFYPPNGSNLTFSGNVNIVTGDPIGPPDGSTRR